MPEREQAASAPAWSDVALGVGVLLLALVLAWQVTLIPEPAYSPVGPRLFPWIAVALLGICGGLLALQGLRGGWPHDEEAGEPDGRGALWMAVGLFLNLVFIDGLSFGEGVPFAIPRLGFILASTLMFVCIARAFESRRPLRDAAIGFLLAVIAYVGFAVLLDKRIGEGLIEAPLRAGIQQMTTSLRGGSR